MGVFFAPVASLRGDVDYGEVALATSVSFFAPVASLRGDVDYGEVVLVGQPAC